MTSLLTLPTTIEMETTDCLLCGGRRFSTVIETRDAIAGGTGPLFRVVRCGDCGLSITNPRPTPASMGLFYPPVGDLPAHRNRPPSGRRRLSTWLKRSAGVSQSRWQRRELACQGGRRLLDFGCGNGEFLQRMHHQGWRVTGLDTSPSAVAYIRNERHLDAIEGTLPHPDLAAESFDAITMWHSLEHAHRPLEILAEAKRLLVPGGRLVVEVPNIASGPFRWFGEAWYGLGVPRHLTHFTPETLRRMIDQAGFRVQSTGMSRRPAWLKLAADSLRDQVDVPLRLRWLRMRPLCSLVSRWFLLTGQSDCIAVSAMKPTS